MQENRCKKLEKEISSGKLWQTMNFIKNDKRRRKNYEFCVII